MEDLNKAPKKKRAKKEPFSNGDLPKGFEALSKLTSSAIVHQVKIGLSKISPLETEEPEQEDPGY